MHLTLIPHHQKNIKKKKIILPVIIELSSWRISSCIVSFLFFFNLFCNTKTKFPINCVFCFVFSQIISAQLSAVVRTQFVRLPNDVVVNMTETSYTFAQFQRSGRITAPATTIPRFKKYSVDDFHFLTVLGKGSFGKVSVPNVQNWGTSILSHPISI